MAELDFIETDSAKITQTILESLQSNVNEPLYPGDERRIFGEALAAVVVSVFNSVNDACRQKMLRYARGSVLDALGQNRDVKRLDATSAVTMLRFSVKTASQSNIVIPQGIRVTGDLSRYFITDKTVVLNAGELSVEVTATAEESGTAYNGIVAGAIGTIVDVSQIPLIESVTNVDVTSGGGDGEADEPYRERIRQAENKLSTAGPAKAYKYHAISANRKVVDAAVISADETIRKTLTVYSDHAFLGGDNLQPETLQISGLSKSNYSVNYEEGLLTITLSGASRSSIDVTISRTMHGCVKIIPICENGEIPDEETLNEVYTACTAEDVKPLTDKVIVEPPGTEPYDIEFTYYVSKADESQVIEAVEGSGGAVDQYVRWQSSELDRDINPDQLRKLLLVAGSTRVGIVKPTYKTVDRISIATFSGNLKVSHITE